jgi:hypothetical protein
MSGAEAMSDLYDVDFILWTEQQATLLRRRAAGELVNDAELDWQNLAQEIEAVGGNTRRELRHRLARLLQHLLKWHYQPEQRSTQPQLASYHPHATPGDRGPAGRQSFLAGQAAGVLRRRFSSRPCRCVGGDRSARSARSAAFHHRAGA